MVSPYFDVGDQILRAEKIDTIVNGIVLDKYKIRPLFMSIGVASDTVKYYRESDEDISASVEVIARGAGFPTKNPTWDDLTAVLKKRGLEVFISQEDIDSDNIDVMMRSLVRLGDAVAKSVDTAGMAAIVAGVGQTVAATIVSGENWASPTRGRPQDAISRAKKLMRIKNYEPDTLLVHPTQAEQLETNDDVMSAFTSAGTNILSQGFTGKFDGLNVVTSNACTAGTAHVLQSGKVGTYATLQPLRTFKKSEDGIGVWVRAWENGVFYITNPNAICSITSTG